MKWPVLSGATLFHIPRTSSAPVLQLIHHLGLQDNIAIETLTFEHVRTAESFGRLNPKRAVPALRLADGKVIKESGAIIALLLDVSGALSAATAVAKGKLWESIFYTATPVFPLVVRTFLETLKKPNEDAAAVAQGAATFKEKIAPALVSDLGDGPWLLSAHGIKEPTAADFVLAKPLSNAAAMGWLLEFPALSQLLEQVKALPTYAPAYTA